MSPEILTQKKASSRILDALAIAGVVAGSSLVLTPIVGNNNFVAGGVKAGIGLMVAGVGKDRWADLVGAGFLVDGATDLLNSFLGSVGGKSLLSVGGSAQSSDAQVFV